MKPLFYITVAAVLALTAADDVDVDVSAELEKHMTQYKELAISEFNRMCPNRENEMKVALEQVEECANKITNYNRNTMCNIFHTHFVECTKPLNKLFVDCVPEDAKGTPEFIFHAMARLNDYICTMDGEHIIELLNPCFWWGGTDDDVNCVTNVMKKYSYMKDKMPTKVQLCHLLDELNVCLGDPLKKSCKNPVTRETYARIFQAIHAGC
ncbi:uncharacterized protein LOC109597117 [Aethina tumida]|uniref:uncharacterized protein LOC109597117 n=1 Tax=Aethina tumida TaxID=116153 RepID=UPI00214846B2|nr:uncharacterized protein LOC109597117 [Aethina tumida]